jgi:hypothetical protein
MKKNFLAIAFYSVAGSMITSHGAPNDVTAAAVNGTWKMKGGEFKVWALGQQRLHVEFSGTYEYKSPEGPMANTGEGHGVASIEGDAAIFKPDGAEDECKITMKFTRDKLALTQSAPAALATT